MSPRCPAHHGCLPPRQSGNRHQEKPPVSGPQSDEFLFVHLKTFLKSDTDILLTYYKSHKKAIANSVEQQRKIKIATTGKQSIAGWLRNTTVVHRTIRRSHTRRRKQAEEKERQKALKEQQRKNRKIVDASAAVRMQHFLQPRTTVIEKVNKRTRKLKEVKERRRRARRKRKQSEHNDESIT